MRAVIALPPHAAATQGGKVSNACANTLGGPRAARAAQKFVRRIKFLGASDARTERRRSRFLDAASAADCIDPAQPAAFFIDVVRWTRRQSGLGAPLARGRVATQDCDQLPVGARVMLRNSSAQRGLYLAAFIYLSKRFVSLWSSR
jgi:hypothetical protein